MITIITALFKGERLGIPHSTNIYTPEWADKLYRGLNRNITSDWEMVCLVDEKYNFNEPIRSIPFLDATSPGWSLLAEMYRADITTNRRLTIGLDTIICSNIDDIISFPLDIGLVSDPMFNTNVCNAISIVSNNTAEHIWKTWTEKRDWVLKECRLPPWNVPSELSMMRRLFNADGRCPRIDIGFPNRIFSYKSHILKKPELLNTASIVYFHGKPKLHQLNNVSFNKKLLEKWI